MVGDGETGRKKGHGAWSLSKLSVIRRKEMAVVKMRRYMAVGTEGGGVWK